MRAWARACAQTAFAAIAGFSNPASKVAYVLHGIWMWGASWAGEIKANSRKKLLKNCVFIHRCIGQAYDREKEMGTQLKL